MSPRRPAAGQTLLILFASLVMAADGFAQVPLADPQSSELSPLWRVRGEYLYWWSNGNPLPPLVTTSPSGTRLDEAGVLGTDGVRILYGDQSIDTGARSGGRITLSRWLDAAEGTALEFVGLYLADDYQSGQFFAESAGDPILSRPFVNATTGLPDAERVAYPDRLAGQVSVDSYSEAYSAAGLLRKTLLSGSQGRIDLLGGYRYFSYRERLSIHENLVSTNPGGIIPLGTTTDLVDGFSVGNSFHGGELGVAGEWLWRSVSIELATKVALGDLFRQSTISGQTVTTVPGEAPSIAPGGLLALPTNMGTHADQRFGVLPEANLNARILLTDRVSLVVGYTVLVLNDVLRTGKQIDPVVNVSQLGGQPLDGVARPAFGFHDSTLLLQGLNLGLEGRW